MAFMLQVQPGCYTFLDNGSGTHRAAGGALGPCALQNASDDFNDELLGVGATEVPRLTTAFAAGVTATRTVTVDRLPLGRE